MTSNRESSIKTKKVAVTAFATKHAMESYGYRFETPDRTLVISGDTNPVETTIEACNCCDVLIHEGQCLEVLARMVKLGPYEGAWPTHLPVQHLVKHHAERKNIGALIRNLAFPCSGDM